ncbi:MAG TPA: hypothetical protein VGS20_16290 [Candidatus Acidoferrales bacterium]|nr:hypothetical protein [Candidatus Acidoferrales bacterium]
MAISVDVEPCVGYSKLTISLDTTRQVVKQATPHFDHLAAPKAYDVNLIAHCRIRAKIALRAVKSLSLFTKYSVAPQ